jgi:hypothetical protein
LLSGASELSIASDFFELAFLAARLRGVFGSIAMAPNPLCVYVNALWLEVVRTSKSTNSSSKSSVSPRLGFTAKCSRAALNCGVSMADVEVKPK